MDEDEKRSLIERIQDPRGTHDREAARAALDKLFLSDLTNSLGDLSGSIHQIQVILAGRIDGLVKEIEKTRATLETSATQASALTTALVTWTRVSVIAIIIYTAITGGLLLVALFGSPWFPSH